MSISLVVKITKPIEISPLLPKIGRALQEILGLSFTPLIEAEEYANQTWLPLTSKILNTAPAFIMFKIVGEPETAPVFAHQRSGDHLSGEGRGEFAVIEVGGEHTPLAFALAGAVAVVIARECGTEIADDMPYFTPVFDQSADDFIEAVRVRDKFDDYHKAAQVFYKSIYAESKGGRQLISDN